jgi:hypothetical protein
MRHSYSLYITCVFLIVGVGKYDPLSRPVSLRYRVSISRTVLFAAFHTLRVYHPVFFARLGPHPWYPSANIFGGMVEGNTVSGAAVLLNIGGAGTSASPFTVFNNTFTGGAEVGVEFLCQKSYSSIFNIAPGSYVDRQGETNPVSSLNIVDCP